MSEFLLEIFCEEIPARMQLKAAENLKGIVLAELSTRQLSFSQVNTLVTPRRLTVVAEGLPPFTLSTGEDRRGPKIGAPEAALQGFLKSAGVKREECQQRDGYYYASHGMGFERRTKISTMDTACKVSIGNI
jgi:glycyl-tRNA synthetase beta chain